MEKKILILYSEFGYGHLSVAKSLQEIIDYQTYLHNCKKEQNPKMTKLIEKVYSDFFTKNASNPIISNLYGFFFWSGNKIKPVVNYSIQKPGYKAVNKLIDKYNPDLIICTYPYKIKTNIPIITVITDYGFANCWKVNKGETYFVTGQNITENLVKKNVLNEKIHITGIPVNNKFDLDNTSKKVSTVLFNLGARGQFKYSNLINCIDKVKQEDLSIIVICGKNENLYNKLIKIYENDKNIELKPFVTNIEEYVDKSDLIVTKAGGISITECIHAQKPMVINKTQSLKGQEQFNVNFVKQNEIGIISKEKNMYESIKEICDNQKKYNQLKDNISKLKKQYNETEIQSLINKLITP